MVIFRVVEKPGLHQVMGNGWLQYVFTVVIVLAGAVAFAVVMQVVIKKVTEMTGKRKQVA